MKSQFPLLTVFLALFVISCSNQSTAVEKEPNTTIPASTIDSSKIVATPKAIGVASAAEMMARKQVPVLCYHHIKDVITKKDGEYSVSTAAFKEQMKALADSGYKTITPDQYYDYLVYGKSLPEKPVMITYDDTDEEQFSIAKPVMDKYGFKGVYFIMTISIGRPRYMSIEQIKQLSDEGHVIASHTWDHSRFDRYLPEHEIEEGGRKKIVNDWDQQLTKTKTKLEEITGKPVEYFAFPFGLWKKEGLPEIEKRGYKMAFQLSTTRDSTQPLYTARRIIVPPQWSAQGMLKVMKTAFK